MESVISLTPTMKDAPEYLRRNLVFPYLEGFKFALTVKEKGGWKAINKMYDDPPLSTEQIMHPRKYLNDRDYPTLIDIPALREMLGDEWELLDMDCLGELNIYVLVREFFEKSKPRTISRVASGWDGDRYWVFENKDNGRLLLIWFTHWDSERDAGDFYKAYKKLLPKKYEKYDKISETDDLVLAVTEEDSTLLEVRGTDVLIVEGFQEEDPLDIEKLWNGVVREEVKDANTLIAFEKKYKKEDPATEEVKTEETSTGIKMSAPDGWTLTASDGEIEARSTTTSGIATAYVVEKNDISLDDFFHKKLNRIKTALDEFSLDYQGLEKTKHLKFSLCIFTGKADEIDPEEIAFALAIAERDGSFVVVTGAARQEDKQAFLEGFEFMLQSLEFK